MPKLPRMSGKEALKVFLKLGFVEVRQRGSHVILKKQVPEGTVGCALPIHKELAVGTLAGALKQAKVSQEEFLANL